MRYALSALTWRPDAVLWCEGKDYLWAREGHVGGDLGERRIRLSSVWTFLILSINLTLIEFA